MKHIAFDLGGSGGKMAVGEITEGRLAFTEVHRFANRQVSLRGDLYWNVLGIYEELLRGIRAAMETAGACVSVGMDSFCNDFGIVDERGTLLSPVHCYRDARAARHQAFVYNRISPARLHALTGNQNALFNTVMQLGALRAQGKGQYFAPGNTLLLLPDLLGFWLTGERRAEFSNASVTQLFSPFTGDWCAEILQALDIPAALLPPVIDPGTVLGAVEAPLCQEWGGAPLSVVAVCSHDTASAVAALPTNAPDAAFLSSGTWSLVGVEIPAPRTDARTLAGNFAVEGGAGRQSRLLKNVMGLWLLQECRHAFAAQGETFSYAQLVTLAEQEPPFRSLIDPDEPEFYMPGDMPEKIAQCCRRTDQPAPERPGQFARCILESLALKYRWALEQLEAIAGRPIRTVHILGGGGQNAILNQFTADATGREVRVGPTEAALCGNLMMQMMAYAEIDSLPQGRELLARSFVQTECHPRDTALWDAPYQRMLKLFNIQTTFNQDKEATT